MQHFLDNYPILYYPEVDSTNIVLKQKLKEQNLTAPFAIAAGFQSAGRGQRQNIWQSTANKNVLCSFLVQGLSLNQLPFITNVAVLAIGKTLEAFGISNYQVKWPNDIFVDEKKIAGILIENVIAGTDLKHCVVGIGLNVNQTEGLLDRATSMASINSNQYPINDVLIYLFQSFYNLLKQEESALLVYINSKLYKKNKIVTFLSEKGITPYTVHTILKNGNLLVSESAQFLELQHHMVKWQL